MTGNKRKIEVNVRLFWGILWPWLQAYSIGVLVCLATQMFLIIHETKFDGMFTAGPIHLRINRSKQWSWTSEKYCFFQGPPRFRGRRSLSCFMSKKLFNKHTVLWVQLSHGCLLFRSPVLLLPVPSGAGNHKNGRVTWKTINVFVYVTTRHCAIESWPFPPSPMLLGYKALDQYKPLSWAPKLHHLEALQAADPKQCSWRPATHLNLYTVMNERHHYKANVILFLAANLPTF